MKRLMTMVVMVVLISSSAEAQFAYLYNPETYISHGFGSRFGGHGLGSILGNYGGYGDSTFGKVLGYGSLGLGAFRVIDQSSTTKQLVNHRISMDDRMMRIIEEKHQNIRGRSNTVLRTTVPIRQIVKIKPKKTQTMQTQENSQELQQKIKILELELEKLKLQQELEKQAKK